MKRAVERAGAGARGAIEFPRCKNRLTRKGKLLSPIILIQGDRTKMRPIIIADGYHRLCAACYADEDAPVAAVMVEF